MRMNEKETQCYWRNFAFCVPVVQNFPATSGLTSKFPERIKLGFSWKYFRLGELACRKLTEGGLAIGQ